MRVLVRLPNWLGDLLMARPLLHALRASLPNAEIWCVGQPASSLLVRERVWDRWHAVGDIEDRLHGFALERRRFDAALILPPSFSSAWMLWRRGIARRIGFAGEWRSWLLTDLLRRPARGEMHLSEEYLSLGARLGIRRSHPLPPLRSSAEELDEARSRLERSEVGGGPFVVLAPGAAYGPAKRWGFGRFVALGRRFTARGYSVLISGSQEERAMAVSMATAIGSRAHAFAGLTSLEEQLALCTLARATVSNDSGLAHLAAASGGPTVVIFGSTSSAWSAPLGPRVSVVQRAPVCSPCFQRTCAIGYVCLEAIEVEQVDRAATEIAA
jgi:heptosyltransferase-2